MSFRLLNISSMYPGYLEAFHKKYPQIDNLSYDDYYNLLLSDTTEFAGSYNKNFRKSGIDAKCIITNDIFSIYKWRSENGIKSRDIKDVIIDQVKAFNPEILWLENLSNINRSWLNYVKKEVRSIKLIIAYHCAPYNQSLLEKLRGVDFVITCTPGIKNALEEEGIRSYLVYHGFDKDLLSRLDVNGNIPKNKLVFSGSLFPGGNIHNDRIAFIERLLNERIELSLFVNLEKSYKIKIKQSIYFLSELLKKINLERLTDKIPLFEYAKEPVKSYSEILLKSNHQPLFGIDMYNLFNLADVVLNFHIGAAGDYAGNMRLFEVTGVGSCLLTDNKKNIGELFDTDNEIVVYNSVEDCIEKAKWLMQHEEERKKIAFHGHKKTLQYHTVEDRCKTIIDIIDKELTKSSGTR